MASDLPVELVPEILKFLVNPAHLASTCLVNKTFYAFASRLLYESITLHSWQKDVKTRAIQLFATLSRTVHLAHFVRSLVIRDFPSYYSFYNWCPNNSLALSNCINLQRCAWTRDGTLNAETLEALSSCPGLRELEIGRNEHEILLLKFTKLQSISIIMPSRSMIKLLPSWIGLNKDNLTSLTLICRMSTFVTDGVLASLKPDLFNLEHFHIAGCPRVGNSGAWSILSANPQGLISLGLEGLKFEYEALSKTCSAHSPNPVRRLRSITAVIVSMIQFNSLMPFLACCSLEKFQVYYPPIHENAIDIEFRFAVVRRHAQTLRRLSLNRILVIHQAIEMICDECRMLEELFIFIYPLDSSGISSLAEAFSRSKTLRSIYVNDSALRPIQTEQIIELLEQCPSQVTQFGYNSEVWEVKRDFVWKNGSQELQLSLASFEDPDVPEQFAVVRRTEIG